VLTGAALAAAAVALMGLWALLLPAYLIAMVGALTRPKLTATVALAVAVVTEGGALDYMAPLSNALYELPPGWRNALFITTSPLEVIIYLVAVVLTVRGIKDADAWARLPKIVWAVPLAMLLGLGYGLAKGGPANLAYTEMRGLIGGIAIFVIAARIAPGNLPRLTRIAMVSCFLLALVCVIRYFFYVRTGATAVPAEFQFAHENSILLGIGVLLGGARMTQAKSVKTALGMALYCAFIFVAMIATGRRAATLVLLVGGLSMAVLLIPRRPVLVIALSVPVLLAGSVYLAAYWNKENGALAQPARAIRSEFDPSLRDESSDAYRQTEKTDVIETIRVARVFGVGFGRPFIQFQGLPNLESFWPLQFYTPHQSVLWLWLKMGWFGISVFLGFWVTVLKRCLERMRTPLIGEQDWLTAAVLFSASTAFLTYATVDLGMGSVRQLGAMAIVAAVALTLPLGTERPAAHGES
jgi:hypothetical protein